MRKLNLDEVRFNAEGLVPVIAQNAESKEVLMLAWANLETLQETIESGLMVYYSRSRSARWLKGETSGDFQEIVSLSLDCDGDTVLAQVLPKGPACHNGTTTCFEEI